MFSILKTLILTFLVIAALQIKVYDRTLESRLLSWYGESTLAVQLEQVVQGAIGLTTNVASSVASWTYRTLGGSEKAEVNKASRLNLEFKRHPDAGSGADR